MDERQRQFVKDEYARLRALEADRVLNPAKHAGRYDTHQVIDNITGQPVRGFPSEDLASSLCRGLNLAAGPGGRYGVRPVDTSTAPLADALAGVDRAQNGQPFSPDHALAELHALRKLAEAVREHLTQPEGT